MKILSAAVFLVIACPAAAIPDEPPRGEWHSTDLRGIEVLQGGTCVRLWFEERTYNIVSAGDSRLTGTYFNVLRAAPVGAPSFRNECKFPPPRENPVATQIRGWSIVGSRAPEGSWRVRAQPGASSGDFHVDKSEEFETRLSCQGERLVDSPDGGGDPDKAFFFRPPAPFPAAARTALEDTIQRLHSGACLEVLSKLAPSKEAAREVCAIRQRLAQISGRLLSISIDGATEIDRVPAGFRHAPAEGYRRQRGVFFDFLGRYEKTQTPGQAVVVEEDGVWNVALLWF